MCHFFFNPLGLRPAAALSLQNPMRREVTVSNDPGIQLLNTPNKSFSSLRIFPSLQIQCSCISNSFCFFTFKNKLHCSRLCVQSWAWMLWWMVVSSSSMASVITNSTLLLALCAGLSVNVWTAMVDSDVSGTSTSVCQTHVSMGAPAWTSWTPSFVSAPRDTQVRVQAVRLG